MGTLISVLAFAIQTKLIGCRVKVVWNSHLPDGGSFFLDTDTFSLS